MKLQDWLDFKTISRADFAAMFKPATHTPNVDRWVWGHAIPRKHHMKQIERITKGAVTAQDFYK